MTDAGPLGNVGRFLTLADLAETLNISVRQAYSLVRSGELPAIKVGGSGRWRVERTVLESYIEAKYEESRRLSMWKQSDFGAVPEFTFGRPAESRTSNGSPDDGGPTGRSSNRSDSTDRFS